MRWKWGAGETGNQSTTVPVLSGLYLHLYLYLLPLIPFTLIPLPGGEAYPKRGRLGCAICLRTKERRKAKSVLGPEHRRFVRSGAWTAIAKPALLRW